MMTTCSWFIRVTCLLVACAAALGAEAAGPGGAAAAAREAAPRGPVIPQVVADALLRVASTADDWRSGALDAASAPEAMIEALAELRAAFPALDGRDPAIALALHQVALILLRDAVAPLASTAPSPADDALFDALHGVLMELVVHAQEYDPRPPSIQCLGAYAGCISYCATLSDRLAHFVCTSDCAISLVGCVSAAIHGNPPQQAGGGALDTR